MTYRLWKTPHVKAGKVYAIGFGEVLIDSVDLLPAALVDTNDLSMTGFRSVKEVWASAGEHAGTVVGPDTLLYRIQFHLVS